MSIKKATRADVMRQREERREAIVDIYKREGQKLSYRTQLLRDRAHRRSSDKSESESNNAKDS